jgi:formate hydrogenlyase subunit 3/multisubunit Na+/H+ antiporter MnhD subunit
MGCLTVFTAGLWAAFQRDLGRILGYAMMSVVGISLLALSQGMSFSTTAGASTSTSLLTADLFLAFFIPNGLALAVWSLGLSIFRSQTESLTFQDIQGLAFRLPFASVGLLAANLSLACLPLLAGYPLYLTLFSKLGARSMIIALFTILGIGGLMISALRTMAALFSNPADPPAWSISETRTQIAFLFSGILLLLIFGLLPQLIQPLSNISIP